MIIRSKDEAPRLRLTLASLERQGAEVVVVDDGSSDHTPEVIAGAAARMRLVAIRHEQARGRSAASNAGARAASGDVLLFLDGDTLGGPDIVARHLAVHGQGPGRVGRGETAHLRCTRWLADPETGAPQPDHVERIARMSPAELDGVRVTRAQVLDDFAAIERRAQFGIYPGAGPRRLYELEMDALRNHPDCSVLWAAASGANLSVGREAFLAAGGYHEQIDMVEQRELAWRLCKAGGRMVPVEGARSYHLTHRVAWRDPLDYMSWEELFVQTHGDPAIRLLILFWASLSSMAGQLPPHARIGSLPELEAAARSGGDFEAARAMVLATGRRAA